MGKKVQLKKALKHQNEQDPDNTTKRKCESEKKENEEWCSPLDNSTESPTPP